ncbi:hypothetical protein FDECE_17716 [Fusarium decemcellulare]|nr:hypothetical protein FDECE_17716 [Fusarium decemcellulare]
MWDCIAFLGEHTANKMNELGGLKFIVISYSHMYTSPAETPQEPSCRIFKGMFTDLLPGLRTAICGKHFDSSMVMHSAIPNTNLPSLFVIYTIFIVASGHNPDPRKRSNIISCQFLRSFLNIIPPAPDVVLKIWILLKPFYVKATDCFWTKAMNSLNKPLHSMTLKARVLQSAKIAAKAMGYTDIQVFAKYLRASF